METYLVTGAAGFIGYHTAKKLLAEGVEVVGIDNLNSYYSVSLKQDRLKQLKSHQHFIFYEGDINDELLLKRVFQNHPITKICHLAAQAGVRYSLTHPLLYEEVNMRGFLAILEAARLNEIKDIVYASSSSVYGSTPMPSTGFSEKQEVNQPISFYGMTKRANELMAYTYHHLYDMNLTGLRFFTVYGPWGRPDMAYYKFVKAIMNGKTIDIYNNGKMKRDFTYIDDIVEGISQALKKSYQYEIFNLGNSQTIPLMDFITQIEETLQIKAKKNFTSAQPGDLEETFADISHAKELLGFSPQTDSRKGIEQFVSWFKTYESPEE